MSDNLNTSDLQQTRNLKISIPGFDINSILLSSVDGYEEISKPFSYRLNVLSIDKKLKSSDILGKDATVSMVLEDNTTRVYHGLVSSFRMDYGKTVQVNIYGGITYFECELVISPKLWLLTQNRKSRIFHNMTSIQIVEKILKEWDVKYDTKLLAGVVFPSLEHCVQFAESDFNFISRLMEQEGVFYSFKHETDNDEKSGKKTYSHSMVLRAVVTVASDTVPSLPFSPGSASETAIHSWQVEDQIVKQKAVYKDYNFAKFKEPFEKEMAVSQVSTLSDEIKKEMVDYHFQAGFRFLADKSDSAKLNSYGEQMVKVHAASVRNLESNWSGKTAKRSLSVGSVFNINDDDLKSTKGFFIKELSFKTSNPDYGSISGFSRQARTEFAYLCDFTAHDLVNDYFGSKNTLKPKVVSQQRAIIVTEHAQSPTQATTVSPQIYVDGHIRVMIKFLDWTVPGPKVEKTGVTTEDEGAKSYWARVANNWAGNNYGMFNLPREGQEVLVSFINGDPDDPVVNGAVFNNVNNVPIDLADAKNKYSTVLRNQAIFDTEQISKGEGESQKTLSIIDNKFPEEMKVWELDKSENRKNFSEIGIYGVYDENFVECGDMNWYKEITGDLTIPFFSDISEGIVEIESKEKEEHEFKEGINFYSNHSILSQAPQKHTMKAGTDITIEAGNSLTLKVGRSSIEITDADIKVKHQYSIIPAKAYANNMEDLKPWMIPAFDSALTFDDKNLSGKAVHTKFKGYLAASQATSFGAEMAMSSCESSIKGAPIKLKAGISLGMIMNVIADSVDAIAGYCKIDDKTAVSGFKMGTGLYRELGEYKDAENSEEYLTDKLCKSCLGAEILKALYDFGKQAVDLPFNTKITMEPKKIDIEGQTVNSSGRKLKKVANPLAGTLVSDVLDRAPVPSVVLDSALDALVAHRELTPTTDSARSASCDIIVLNEDQAAGREAEARVTGDDLAGSQNAAAVSNGAAAVSHEAQAVNRVQSAVSDSQPVLATTSASATNNAAGGASSEHDAILIQGAPLHNDSPA